MALSQDLRLRIVDLVASGVSRSRSGNSKKAPPSSLGRLTGAVRRYPGGSEYANIFETLSRLIPKSRAILRPLSPS